MSLSQRNISTFNEELSRKIILGLQRASMSSIFIMSGAVIQATKKKGRSLLPNRIEALGNEIFLNAKKWKPWAHGSFVFKHLYPNGWIGIVGNHCAFISEKVRSYVWAHVISYDDIVGIIGSMQISASTKTPV